MSTIEENSEGPVDLAVLLRIAHREMMKSVHTMLPGVVESFDAGTQRAKVNLATAQETTDGTKLSFPPLVNVPVQFFRWGGFSITAPPKAGDECAVFFSERSMDDFLNLGGADRVPTEGRFFDLSDAYIVPGLNSDGNIVPNFDADNLVLKSDNGSTVMTLTQGGKFSVENASGELVTTISDTLNVLKSETVTVTGGSSAGTYPVNGQATYASLKSIIDSFKR